MYILVVVEVFNWLRGIGGIHELHSALVKLPMQHLLLRLRNSQFPRADRHVPC